MSDIVALTQEAQRRVRRGEFKSEGVCGRRGDILTGFLDFSDEQKELLLLAAVAFLLIRSGADYMLLLAIMYVLL